MANLKIFNKINMLQLDEFVDGLAIIVERLNGIQNLTDGHETMPAFLHQPVPLFDGDIMTEGIERTANKLIGCSIYWTAVQFSGN